MRPGPPGSARLSCSESSVVTTHTFPTLRVLESDRTLVEGNFHPQPSAGALFRPRAGCLESQSRKECLRAMTSRLPGRQTTCRDQPAAARRFMLQHHGCIKKGGKKKRWRLMLLSQAVKSRRVIAQLCSRRCRHVWREYPEWFTGFSLFCFIITVQ